METIKDTIDRVMQDLAKKARHKNEPLSVWRKSVGKSTLRHTRVMGLKNGRLIINVDNSSWLYDLNTKQEQILDKLKELSPGSIKQIKFRLGRID